MSRRKQLHPKPIKDSGKDEIDQVCRSHNLPSHILHLQELTDDPELDFSVHSISTILQGSQFGPFSCAILENVDEEHNNEGNCIMECPVSGNSDAKLFVSIESASGHWLKLLRKNADIQLSNVKLYIQDENTLWCEVLKNILPDMELVATLLLEDNKISSISSSSSATATTSSCFDPGTSRVEVKNGEQQSPSPLTGASSHSGVASPSKAVPNALPVGSIPWENHPSLFVRRERKSAGIFPTADADVEHSRPTFSLIHVCMYCGVRFSSPRTLQAHIANYCSKKPPEHSRVVLPSNQPPLGFSSPAADITNSFLSGQSVWRASSPEHFNSVQSKVKCHKRSLEEDEDTISSAPKVLCKTEKDVDRMEGSDSGNEGKGAKGTRRISVTSETDISSGEPAKEDGVLNEAVFPCPHCPYSFDSSSSLTHHLRVHYLSPPETSPGADRQAPGSNEYVCSSCNIKFSSLNTYRGHKEFYCQKRSHTSTKTKFDLSPEPSSSESTLPISPFCPLPASRMPMFSPGSTVFPPPIFPPPCLQPTNGLFVSQAQAVFLATAPFLGSSSIPSMAFNVPIVVQPIAPLLTNGLFPSSDHRASETDKNPQVKRSSSAAACNIKKSKSGSDLVEEKPLDLSTRRRNSAMREKATVVPKEKSPAPKQALSDGEQLSNGSAEFGRTSSLSNVTEGRKDESPNYLTDSVTPLPSSLLSSPFAVSSILPMGSALSPRAADLALSPAMAPPSISKCTDCNIVFYKHENYIAHKEHYCAGRFSGAGVQGFARRPSLQSISSLSGDNRVASGSILGGTSIKPVLDSLSNASALSLASEPRMGLATPKTQSPELVATLDQGTLQYYCIPCKIKFSSLDTLKAHKKYYCPSKSENPAEEQSTVAKAEENSNGSRGRDANDLVMLACSSCGNTFASAQLLKLHYCTGTMVHYPLFHCPYCDYIAQSDSRLVDHIKAHAPSKAYKCVLCGYRGNTVRGMRMHGKMHNDAGETFTDDSMIEYEEPPMIPKRLRSAGDGGFADVEVDLIRLKNEPYKRRRSRKAYEKSEFCQGPAPTRCVECKEMFSDPDQYQAHMQTHVTEKLRAWKSCDLNPNSTADLLQLQAKLYPGSVKSSNQSAAEKCRDDANSAENHTIVKNSDVESSNSLTCSTAENIDIALKDSFQPSAVKEEQIDVDSVENSGPSREAKTPSENDEYLPTDDNQTPTNSSKLDPLLKLKEELLDVEAESENSETQATNTADQVADDDSKNATGQRNGRPDSRSSSDLTDNANLEKYCKQCNITFMYTSTFIAHKKYYCSSHTDERNAGPTVA